MNYVDTIAKVLAKHRYYYDGFDQNTDVHHCICKSGGKETIRPHGGLYRRNREEVEQHIAEEIAKVVGVSPVHTS